MYIVNKRWILQGKKMMKEYIFGMLRLYLKRFHFMYVMFMAANIRDIYVTFIGRWRFLWGTS